jgi:pimeloyl-ACP methyl ester carboxylesterase
LGIFTFFVLAMAPLHSQSKVAVVKNGDPFQLMVNGKPFFIHRACVSPFLSLGTGRALFSAEVCTVNVKYSTADVNGIKILYREAGNPSTPTLLLLHGFPSSSHMFRNLIPLLAEKYHLVAPGFPGFGQSDMPERSKYPYTFANIAETIARFTESIGLKKFAIYIFDYGSPLAFAWPSRIGHNPIEQNRDGIGLLSGATARAPNSQTPFRCPPDAQQFRKDLPGKNFKAPFFPEKNRFLPRSTRPPGFQSASWYPVPRTHLLYLVL